jgi:transposase
MLSVLFGLEGAEVLRFVEDEENDAFAILVTLPSQTNGCPRCGGRLLELEPVDEDLPATTAGEKHLLIRWRRRRFECAEATCDQSAFKERNEDVDAFIARLTRRGPITAA